MTEVSVVIPTRNRLVLLQEAVESIEKQTFTDWELVVVDDASEDDTWAWLSHRPDDRLRTIRHTERSERSAARNDGLRASTGRYVIFLDDDDRLVPSGLERLVKALERHPDALAAAGNYEQFNANGDRRRGTQPRRIVERPAWHDALFHWVANPSRTLFRSEVICRLDGFRLGAHQGFEDWDLWLRVTKLGPVVLIPDVVVEYRVHAGQQVTRDERAVLSELAAQYAATLEGPDRAVAERLQRARETWLDASRELTELHAWSSFKLFTSAIRTEPSFLSSPISRPIVLRPLGKAAVGIVVGRRGTLALRRIMSLVRKATRRDVWIKQARLTDEDQR
jgi:glycosyltransferase involved in cell wall biosynthesis